MPFKAGISGNAGGRKRTLGLSRAVRKSEGWKTWCMLLGIRDGKVREQVVDQKTGEVYDVVPSVREYREVCKLILAYTWGTPVQAGTDELEKRLEKLEELLAGKLKPEGQWPAH
jgi:hypothetical protein